MSAQQSGEQDVIDRDGRKWESYGGLWYRRPGGGQSGYDECATRARLEREFGPLSSPAAGEQP